MQARVLHMMCGLGLSINDHDRDTVRARGTAKPRALCSHVDDHPLQRRSDLITSDASMQQ